MLPSFSSPLPPCEMMCTASMPLRPRSSSVICSSPSRTGLKKITSVSASISIWLSSESKSSTAVSIKISEVAEDSSLAASLEVVSDCDSAATDCAGDNDSSRESISSAGSQFPAASNRQRSSNCSHSRGLRRIDLCFPDTCFPDLCFPVAIDNNPSHSTNADAKYQPRRAN